MSAQTLARSNRAALVAADFVVIPLGADLFSLQGLQNLGPTLRDWRSGWQTRKRGKVPAGLSLPSGRMEPLGYVLLNPSVRENRPVKSYLKWANRIPTTYAKEVLNETPVAALADEDENQLAMLKHFKSLMPMAQDARKPMFHLTAADGAIGGHAMRCSRLQATVSGARRTYLRRHREEVRATRPQIAPTNLSPLFAISARIAGRRASVVAQSDGVL